ncbi:MAG: DUF2147 domain-containing protein [Bacteroidia bacterium]|nr:DUF2147 domain-containing protein [Bacteroidia bacterium]
MTNQVFCEHKFRAVSKFFKWGLWGTVLFWANLVFAQNNPDAVCGKWLTGSKEGHVEIYKAKDGKYYGKICWLKNPNNPDGTPKLDTKNPDEAARKKPIMGLLVLRGFSYDPDEKEWVDGKIYDPKNGNDYSCTMSLKDANTLNVRGYIGISLLGRTEVWERVK